MSCLLYTSDAADERSSVDLGGRRIIKKKNRESNIILCQTTSEHDDNRTKTRVKHIDKNNRPI